jgi:hypothetical protein
VGTTLGRPGLTMVDGVLRVGARGGGDRWLGGLATATSYLQGEDRVEPCWVGMPPDALHLSNSWGVVALCIAAVCAAVIVTTALMTRVSAAVGWRFSPTAAAPTTLLQQPLPSVVGPARASPSSAVLPQCSNLPLEGTEHKAGCDEEPRVARSEGVPSQLQPVVPSPLELKQTAVVRGDPLSLFGEGDASLGPAPAPAPAPDSLASLEPFSGPDVALFPGGVVPGDDDDVVAATISALLLEDEDKEAAAPGGHLQFPAGPGGAVWGHPAPTGAPSASLPLPTSVVTVAGARRTYAPLFSLGPASVWHSGAPGGPGGPTFAAPQPPTLPIHGLCPAPAAATGSLGSTSTSRAPSSAPSMPTGGAGFRTRASNASAPVFVPASQHTATTTRRPGADGGAAPPSRSHGGSSSGAATASSGSGEGSTLPAPATIATYAAVVHAAAAAAGPGTSAALSTLTLVPGGAPAAATATAATAAPAASAAAAAAAATAAAVATAASKAATLNPDAKVWQPCGESKRPPMPTPTPGSAGPASAAASAVGGASGPSGGSVGAAWEPSAFSAASPFIPSPPVIRRQSGIGSAKRRTRKGTGANGSGGRGSSAAKPRIVIAATSEPKGDAFEVDVVRSLVFRD